MARLTKAQRALVCLINGGFGPRYFSRREAEDRGLLQEFMTARRAGLIQSAGYECSVAGDDFLGSPAGRAALAEAEGKGGGNG